ncbi:DUF2577 family protein [Paenibacillus gansuensis]|uniref:DUF2577 family protein n=1 Tax=Paenibacillus gansuensis TaxID=306542 RepID=A0ABW5PEU2_9BACL
MSIIDSIKTIVEQHRSAAQPAAFFPATVMNTNPLEVNVDQRFTLTADFLIVLEHCKTFAPGDRLLLLRDDGGQQFVILGRMV